MNELKESGPCKGTLKMSHRTELHLSRIEKSSVAQAKGTRSIVESGGTDRKPSDSVPFLLPRSVGPFQLQCTSEKVFRQRKDVI